MQRESATLPPQFADLAPFSEWCLPTESARRKKRLATPMAEIRAFYDAMLPRLSAALEYLNRFPLEQLNDPERQLMDLTLALAEVSVAVEVYGQPDHPFGIELTRFVAGHEAGRE